MKVGRSYFKEWLGREREWSEGGQSGTDLKGEGRVAMCPTLFPLSIDGVRCGHGRRQLGRIGVEGGRGAAHRPWGALTPQLGVCTPPRRHAVERLGQISRSLQHDLLHNSAASKSTARTAVQDCLQGTAARQHCLLSTANTDVQQTLMRSKH